MAAQPSQGLANRLGYSLGRGVRFFLYDQLPVVRWMKRLMLFAAMLFVSVLFFQWLAGTFLTVISMGLILFAAVKGDFSCLDDLAASEAKEAPNGRDVFGRKLDCWGNVDGEWPDQ